MILLLFVYAISTFIQFIVVTINILIKFTTIIIIGFIKIYKFIDYEISKNSQSKFAKTRDY